ncbi:MAG TPA: ABC transporter substrate-binding protein [Lichenihabitans sp.]|jgi:trehalose/maltose transport system substrate-binding protein|nr:ABC transporter substrate-binding protein [Lichenihabitans sp.]
MARLAKSVLPRALLFGATVALAALAAGGARAETISFACGAVGLEFETCKAVADMWAKKTGNEVKLVSTPNSTTERLALYQQLLAAGSPDVDVFEIDVIWPGILGSYFVDLKPYTKGAEKDHFPVVIDNDTRDGKLIAMPMYTDAGMLFYRKDLLDKYAEKPPATWADLAATAKKVQDGERAAGNAGMQGFVFQAKAYEGLTCNAIEWVASYGGGTIVDKTGKVTIDNAQAAKALDEAASWIKTIAPEGVLNYAEEETRGVFQSGNAVFMRNWPYAWPLSQSADSPVKGKVGVMPLPEGQEEGARHASALGGWQLAVSKFSKHQDLAGDLVAFMTSTEAQKYRAVKGGYQPTIPALYQDKEVLDANPFFKAFFDSVNTAVARPSTPTGGKYNQVSNEFWNATYDVLTGKSSGKDAVAALAARLNRMSRGGKW